MLDIVNGFLAVSRSFRFREQSSRFSDHIRVSRQYVKISTVETMQVLKRWPSRINEEVSSMANTLPGATADKRDKKFCLGVNDSLHSRQ